MKEIQTSKDIQYKRAIFYFAFLFLKLFFEGLLIVSKPQVQNIYKFEMLQNIKIYTVAIRRQDKSVWQRRTPLIPQHIKELLASNPQIKFIVQPSKKRIFSDWEYENIGAILQEDISQAQLIIGVKEIPLQKLIPNKTFMFFSHTIKAQSHNMPTLDLILKQNIRLIDYEKITDDSKSRLIAFGKYAGIAGALDFLKGIGQYIMQMGISTPLLNCNCAYKYFQIQEAYSHLKTIGKKITEKQVPEQLRPMIFAITGRGRTAQGCWQVLKNLPITQIQPNQVQKLCQDKNNPAHRKTIYVVNINSQDTIQHRDPQIKFDKHDYYKHPQKYKSVFKTKYLPYITALFHCIYWDVGCPVYIKNKHLKELASQKKLRLLGICDISCDIDGSIQCLKQYTQPQKPFFYHNSFTEEQNYQPQYLYGKFPYLAVDFLPCELAYDASQHFSTKLKNWIPMLVKSDKNAPIQQQQLIPELKRAVITTNKKLTPDFEYIAKLREENELKINTMMKKKQQTKTEIGATASVLHDNVSIVKKIKPKKIDFQEDK